MASKITVTIGYDDGSKSFTESYVAADTHPSAEIVKEIEENHITKWLAMGNQIRSTKLSVKVTHA